MLSTYEESLKNFWDLNNCLDSAERKGFEKGEASGMKKGKEEGLAEGLEKGEAIGLEKGLQNAARRLKQAGMPVYDISRLIGLEIDKIEKL